MLACFLACFLAPLLAFLLARSLTVTQLTVACHDGQVLHVRSVSSWAPVCIGPYCQANTLGPGNALALIAGQIGLLPASMVLPPRRAAVARRAALAASDGDPTAVAPPGDHALVVVGAGVRVEEGEVKGEEGGGGKREASFHGIELELCVRHASAVASAVGSSLSRCCAFATLYVSEEAALAAAAAARAYGATSAGVPAGGKAATPTSTTAAAAAAGTEPVNAVRTASRPVRHAPPSSSWMQSMVEECRGLIEEGFAREQAEANAEAAGTGTGGAAGDGGDSAEEGWTSDPEELAKEAARKKVRVREPPHGRQGVQ